MILKSTQEDFLVEEVLDLELKERGNYAYFILEKRNWTSLKALQYIAKQLRVNVKRFAIAGQKDRQAITRQHVSVYQISERILNSVRLKDLNIEFLGYGDNPIRLGQLKGNKFKIVARELEKPFKPFGSVANYYDDQRFGGYRPNLHLIGKDVLLGKYEDAVKGFLLYPFPGESEDYVEARTWMEKNWGTWKAQKFSRHMNYERSLVGYLANNPEDFKGALKQLPRQLFTMITQAYQSYIFNESLYRYLKDKYKGEKSYREVDYSVGKMAFVRIYEDIDWPLVGYESQLEGDIKKFVEEVMKEENIWYETFNCEIPALSSKGITRKAMVHAKQMKVGEFKEGVQDVSFFLPKGSYATVVMKSITS